MLTLVDASEELSGIGNVHYPGHAWSVVKLLLLWGWVHVYTTIIPKYFEDFRYVDLLAGTGTTVVDETGDVVVGSPFLAHFFARCPFTRYVYVEKRHHRCEVLRQRAASLIGDSADVLEGDCNELIERVLPEGRRVHSLVFVDNEGFDATWKTIEWILETNTDALILFPTSSVLRVAGSGNLPSLERFFGDRSWLGAQSTEDFLQVYLQKLGRAFESLRKKGGYVSNVRVGSGQFYYDVVLVCKKGPYVRAWEYLKKRLDWQDPSAIEITLDVLKGRATRIDWFLDLHEKVESLERGQMADTTTTLDKYL